MGRAILVVEEQPYLWAALRQRIDPALAYVRGAAPAELAAVWRTCPPWPWLVACTSPDEPRGLTELLGANPIPVHWVGDPPGTLRARPTCHRDWTGLVATLERLTELTERGVGGVRLLRNRGLQLSDGRIVLEAANVEGLLAAPQGLALPPAAAQAVQREIADAALPLTLERSSDLLRLAALSSCT